MSTPALLLAGLVAWVGVTLVLSTVPWFARPRLVDRLRPYEARPVVTRRRTALSAQSLSDVVGVVASVIGGRLSRLLGVHDDLATRLDRIGAADDADAVRLRQLGWSSIALLAGTAVAVVLAPPPLVTGLFVVGAPALAFLLIEQRISVAVDDRRRRLRLELPVVAEQLGMLLGSGYSLTGALRRVADRGAGVSGDDLGRAVARIQQGATEAEALAEWAERSGLDDVRRLTTVLALDREAGDLGRLVAAEARSIRREVHRHRIEVIEKRSQQVWIPVTVAALVPGAILIAIPFLQALRAFGAT